MKARRLSRRAQKNFRSIKQLSPAARRALHMHLADTTPPQREISAVTMTDILSFGFSVAAVTALIVIYLVR